MTNFVALLRGINVGKARRVPMAELRALLTQLGYTGVATLLNSGNAVFRAADGSPAEHATRIAAAMHDQLGLEVPVVVKTADELAEIIAECPIDADGLDHSKLLVAFAQDAAGLSALESVAPLAEPPDRFVIGPHAAYSHCAGGILASKASTAMLRKAGKSATTRNWATVLKIKALCE